MPVDPQSLPFWLGVPAALFLLIVPGFVTRNLILTFGLNKNAQTSKRGSTALTSVEKVFWTLALSIGLVGWLAFTLAEVGWYSIGLLIGLATFYSVIIGVFLQKRGFSLSLPFLQNLTFKKITARQNWDSLAIVAVLLMTSGLFGWRTHETIVGAQDSGTYYDTGINIAQTGSIMIHDPLLPTFSASGQGPFDVTTEGKLQAQLMQGMPGEVGRYLFISHQRLPGYFVYDNEQGLQTGDEIAQSFHLYPVLIAIAYSLFGLFGGLYVTPFLGLMGVFAVYLTARRLFPTPRQRWIAVLAALLLALNPAEVWFVRETLWETLGQFLTFTGIYAITLYAKPYPLAIGETEPDAQRDYGTARLGAFGAGLAFGLIGLAHSQFIFIIAPLFPLLVYLRLTRRWSREVWWLVVPFALLLLHTIIHIRHFALGYFEGIYHHELIFFGDTIIYWFPLLVLLIVGLIIVDAMPARVLAVEKWVVVNWKWASLGAAMLIVGYLFYSYFIRVFQYKPDWHEDPNPIRNLTLQSYVGAPTTIGRERNLLRLGWYMSPLGILLVLVGFWQICWRKLNLRTAMFLAITCILTLIFLDQSYTQEHFIYTMRRYVPVTFPAFSLLIAYAVVEVLPQAGGWLFDRLTQLRSGRQRKLATSIAGSSSAALTMPRLAFSIIEDTNINSPDISNEAGSSSTAKTKNWGFVAGRYLGWMCALGLVAFSVVTGITIYRLQQYDGVTNQLENLAQNFGPKDIIIFSGDPATDGKIAVPLNYVFDRQSFILTPAPKNDMLGQVLSYWQKQGYHIKAMLSTNGGRFAPEGFDLVPTGDFRLKLTQLQNLDNQKPKNVETDYLDYGIYDVQPHSGATGTLKFGRGTVSQTGGWQLHMGSGDYAALIDGFWPAEKNRPTDLADLTYRWTDGDPLHHPTLRLPCFTPNAKSRTVSLTLSPGLNPNAVALKVYLSNYIYDNPTDPKTRLKQAVGTIQVTPGSTKQTYTLSVPDNLPYVDCTSGSLTMYLVTTQKEAFVPQQVNKSLTDTRLLGLKLYAVGLKSQ